MPAPSD